MYDSICTDKTAASLELYESQEEVQVQHLRLMKLCLFAIEIQMFAVYSIAMLWIFNVEKNKE